MCKLYNPQEEHLSEECIPKSLEVVLHVLYQRHNSLGRKRRRRKRKRRRRRKRREEDEEEEKEEE